MIPATAENAPANTPFNQTLPTAAQLSAYAANGYTSTFQDDYTQYKRVDGQYSGSTDMIMRWAACKYGIEEDVVRAQGWIESGWQQGGAGDKRTSQAQCVQGSFTALWNTTISEPGGSTVSCPNCCYQSWSLWQTKVYYEWMTWPQIMQSTAFAADYRYAEPARLHGRGLYHLLRERRPATEHLRGRRRQLQQQSRRYQHGPGVVRLHRHAPIGLLV